MRTYERSVSFAGPDPKIGAKLAIIRKMGFFNQDSGSSMLTLSLTLNVESRTCKRLLLIIAPKLADCTSDICFRPFSAGYGFVPLCFQGVINFVDLNAFLV